MVTKPQPLISKGPVRNVAAAPADIASSAYRDGLVPLTVGVTGHRDLLASEISRIRLLVRSFLAQLQEQFPDRPLELLSALAEGADRLVAEVALEIGIRLTVALPMSREDYIEDFQSASSRQEFEELCNRAARVYELPPAAPVELLRKPGEDRNRQYAQLGVFLCAHSHVLLALWDGKPSNELGGTAQVVRFHHDDVMVGYAESSSINQQLLADDESDLVYHVVVSRDRPEGAPLAGLDALTCAWVTTNDEQPRTESLPDRYRKMFERTSVFNRDARAHISQILEESYPLVESSTVELPDDVHAIDRLFCAADWLAIHFQQLTHSTLRLTHGLAFLMGMMFILYSDAIATRSLMFAFLICFAVAYIVHTSASRGEWHSKYLEYRALAEGLRVQFYWAAAGVGSESITKYAHDNFLQKQDIELGWIRNVMRVAGIGCDVTPNRDPEALRFVIRSWIGSETAGGQLKYYRRKAGHFIERSRQIGSLQKIIGVVSIGLLVAMVVTTSDLVRDSLVVILGAILLLISIREAYAFRVAEKDMIKQYEFMYRIFNNARRRLSETANDSEQRRILRILGESALDEHAEWILLHRDRPPDRGGVWRMES